MHFRGNNPGCVYKICKKQTKEVKEGKDLGVTLDLEMKFNQHSAKLVVSSDSKLGLVKISLSHLEPKPAINVYKRQSWNIVL